MAILWRCCPQVPTFYVVAHNTEKCSNFSSRAFFRALAHNVNYFSALWTTASKNDPRWCLHHRKTVGIVGNNAKKCLNLNISMNLQPVVNLPWGFNQGPRLMCFMKKSWDEKSLGTVPFKNNNFSVNFEHCIHIARIESRLLPSWPLNLWDKNFIGKSRDPGKHTPRSAPYGEQLANFFKTTVWPLTKFAVVSFYWGPDSLQGKTNFACSTSNWNFF